jgi:hypothetical protein
VAWRAAQQKRWSQKHFFLIAGLPSRGPAGCSKGRFSPARWFPVRRGAFMSAGSGFRRLGPSLRGKLEVAAAVAREEVFALHTRRAEAIVRLAADRVAIARMLEIYVRLHGLREADGLFVSNRVLATIGLRERVDEQPSGSGPAGEPDDAESLVHTLRKRLRGRVHEELRFEVELAVGATEVELLRLHTLHAARFVEIMGPDAASISAAVGLYCEAVHMRAPLADVLYWHVLDRIAAGRPGLGGVEAGTTAEREIMLDDVRASPGTLRRALPAGLQRPPRERGGVVRRAQADR